MRDQAVSVDIRAQIERRGWRVTQHTASVPDGGVIHTVVARGEPAPGDAVAVEIRRSSTSMRVALDLTLSAVTHYDARKGEPAQRAARVRATRQAAVEAILADPATASLKKIALAYGTARSGSEQEARLRGILIARISDAVDAVEEP